jgi:hypothetical protein
MGSIHGKNTLSFRRTKSSTADQSSPIILQDYKFAHESVLGGETVIDLDALVTPTSINTGIINPVGGQLAAINLKNNSNSIVIISSDKGTLQQGSWQISNSGRQINLAYETEPNEIFTVQVRATQATANVVDADAFAITGTLLAGETDIPLGQVFTLNANPTEQIGEVILTIDGVEQLRNVNNAVADPLADGNYQEVESGSNQMNLLRLNEAFPVDVAYSVKANGLIVNAEPNNSVTQKLESLGGQLDAIIPTVADLAGVPDTDFQGAPNNVDLKAFSDKVYKNSDDIASNYAANLSLINQILDTEVPIVTEYQAFTPDIFIDPGNFSFSSATRWKRIGDEILIEFSGSFSGNSTAGSLSFFLPDNLRVTENKIRYTAGQGELFKDGLNDHYWVPTDSRNDSGTNRGFVQLIFSGLNPSIPSRDSGDRVSGYLRAKVEGWEATETIRQKLGL